MTAFVSRFVTDIEAATAIEYGLIAGGIALAIVAAISALSAAVKSDFDAVVLAWPS